MSDIPKPITRQDQYYNYLINGGDINKLPEPIDRIDHYLYYLCVNGFGGGGTGDGGTTNYNALQNKPQINNVTLQGSLTSEDIGISIPETLPNPKSITFDGMLKQQTYDGSQAVSVIFPDVEILNEISGTPIGSIEAYMGTIAPPNYLICDGAEYQIADYPYLAQHFNDNFESVNFFGGDGETTFAVPDLRGEFLRGTGTAERNTGSGASVGTHQEATRNVEWGHYSNGHFQFPANNAEVTNVDKHYDSIDGIRYATSTAYTGKRNTYYTSRPTNTAVLYCIKCKPTYFATVGHTYSYEERRVGTWVDGKPLYEKTVDFGSLPDNATKEYMHEINLVGELWIHDGWIRSANNASLQLLIFSSSFMNTANFSLTPSRIICKTNTNLSTYNAIVVLRYTKTTD